MEYFAFSHIRPASGIDCGHGAGRCLGGHQRQGPCVAGATGEEDRLFERCTTYRDARLREIAFPLGGIGTGTVSLTGAGGLAEWQIRNRPDQDSINEHTFFSVWARQAAAAPVARVLEGPVQPPYNRHHRAVHGQRFPGGGLGNAGVFGLPHVQATTFHGAYPFARVEYHDAALPVEVTLDAYNPMIPTETDDSGIPCALFRFRLRNRTRQRVAVTLAMSMRGLSHAGQNRIVRGPGFTALCFDDPAADPKRPDTGTIAVATPWRRTTHRTEWYRLAWFDPLQTMWDQFAATGALVESRYATPPARRTNAGTIGMRVVLRPGAEALMPLWVTWSFPVYEFPFGEADQAGRTRGGPAVKPHWRNWYAHRFPTALHVVRYLVRHEPRLYQATRRFREALEASTVHPAVLDAVSSQMSIIRSPTCQRLEDGAFYGWEGSHERAGSCPGSCTHVWNYAQALAFLYPTLAQSMHSRSYRWNFSPSGSGAMAFRIPSPPHRPRRVPLPAVDGQMGEIVRIYQLWRLTGDTPWLRSLWPGMRRALEFAWRGWDWRRRGVVEGIAHNTYDIEFWGPNAYGTAYYHAALEACARIAERFGERERASTYRGLIEQGRRWIDSQLWNGRYYEQRVDPRAWQHSEHPMRPARREAPGMKRGEPKYQYGTGCLSDQLTGQWLGRMAGLGLQFDPAKVRTALRSVFRHNFRRSLRHHANCQRAFALQDEAALVLCTWPRGGRPVLPFIYCDEAWTGVEYAVASHLLAEGMEQEALAIVRAIGRRHDGERRNPWNQFEAGSYYARALSSWALLTAASGVVCDAAEGMLGFDVRPKRCTWFWSAQQSWGTVSRDRSGVRLRVDHGTLTVRQLQLRGTRLAGRVRAGGRTVTARCEGDTIYFARLVRLAAGAVLHVR